MSYLEGSDGRTLEPEISFEVLSNFSHQTLEWQLTDEKLGGFLVTPDLTESHGAGPVSVGFLDTTGGRGALTCGLGGKLFTRSFTSGGFTGCLLGTSHSECVSLTNPTLKMAVDGAVVTLLFLNQGG